ncbi:MAG: DUF2442 domain-containing protein [Oscillospiraceae bacterium]|nr:DUF2442 domain-containing protein [Oscillospiraceae bacterium]
MQGIDFTRFFPQVLQAVATDDYKVYSYFNDGSVRCFNVKPLIKPDTVFAPLEDIEIFKGTLTVLNDTAAWDLEGNRDLRKCIDIDPFTLFEAPESDEPIQCRMQN